MSEQGTTKERFDWGKAYYAGIHLGYDEGYAAFRADRMEKRWALRADANQSTALETTSQSFGEEQTASLVETQP